ncbi:MAG: hypothetical protein ACOZBW_06705 [Thermodesulfobacteriota bacterium]
MVNRKFLMAALLLVGAVLAVALMMVDWEARAVKKRMRSLEQELQWAPEDNDLVVAARVKRVGEMVADPCRVDMPTYEVSRFFSQKDVAPYLMMALRRYSRLAVEFHDLVVEITAPGKARVIATAYVRALTLDGQRADEVLELAFELEKTEKEWRMLAVEEVPVLEK